MRPTPWQEPTAFLTIMAASATATVIFGFIAPTESVDAVFNTLMPENARKEARDLSLVNLVLTFWLLVAWMVVRRGGGRLPWHFPYGVGAGFVISLAIVLLA